MRDLISISSGHWTTENTCSGFKGRNWGQTNNTEILKGGRNPVLSNEDVVSKTI